MEVTAMVQAREQAGRQREAGHLEVQAGAGGRAPHPVCLGKSTRTASLVEANGRAGGSSQSHRVWQEEDWARGFKCGLVTPQRFSTQGSQARSVHLCGADALWAARPCRRVGARSPHETRAGRGVIATSTWAAVRIELQLFK